MGKENELARDVPTLSSRKILVVELSHKGFFLPFVRLQRHHNTCIPVSRYNSSVIMAAVFGLKVCGKRDAYPTTSIPT